MTRMRIAAMSNSAVGSGHRPDRITAMSAMPPRRHDATGSMDRVAMLLTRTRVLCVPETAEDAETAGTAERFR